MSAFNYMPLMDYPAAIYEIEQALVDNRRQKRAVETAMKFRKAHLIRHNKPKGTVEGGADNWFIEQSKLDDEYRGLMAREEELELTNSRLSADLNLLRNQFAVMKIKAYERIHNTGADQAEVQPDVEA